MNHLINLVSLLLTASWNLGVLLGSMWLILEKDWSPWTLVATICFFAKWRTVEEQTKEQSKIILPNAPQETK